jgi:hypothetical protein
MDRSPLDLLPLPARNPQEVGKAGVGVEGELEGQICDIDYRNSGLQPGDLRRRIGRKNHVVVPPGQFVPEVPRVTPGQHLIVHDIVLLLQRSAGKGVYSLCHPFYRELRGSKAIHVSAIPFQGTGDGIGGSGKGAGVFILPKFFLALIFREI